MSRLAILIPIISALPAAAGEPEWHTVATGDVTVKARPRPGSGVLEIWAEADLKAPVKDIQDALTVMDRFAHFMPYVKTAREVSREADGSVFTYTQLDLPVITNRDYVVHVWTDEGVKADGSGAFRCHWKAAPDKLPKKDGFIRLTVNEGTWNVTPKADGRSHVVYRFTADPGGMLPNWVANYGNKHGVSSTLEAIEKEAQRRQKAREALAGKLTSPAVDTGATSPALAPSSGSGAQALGR
jgi:hypothetical protein